MAVTEKRYLNPDTNQFEDAQVRDGEDAPQEEGKTVVYFPQTGRTFFETAYAWEEEGQKLEEQANPSPAAKKTPKPQPEAQPQEPAQESGR